MIDSESAARAWLANLSDVDAAACDRLERLVALLAEENVRQNLVSRDSLQHVWQRHVADSAQLLLYVPRETDGPWLDLGTGAGFPGLVIAALRPETRVVLIESRNRRIDWLTRAAEALGLAKVKVVGRRVETVESCTAAVISARAFAPLQRLLELAARFSTSDTLWVLPKGRSARDELAGLNGWVHQLQVTPSLTDAEAGIVIGTVAGIKARGKGHKA